MTEPIYFMTWEDCPVDTDLMMFSQGGVPVSGVFRKNYAGQLRSFSDGVDIGGSKAAANLYRFITAPVERSNSWDEYLGEDGNFHVFRPHESIFINSEMTGTPEGQAAIGFLSQKLPEPV